MKVILLVRTFTTQTNLDGAQRDLQQALDEGYEIASTNIHPHSGQVLFTLVQKPKGRPPGKKGKGDEGGDEGSD